MPTLLTAPLEENRTKLAAEPKKGAWEKVMSGKNKMATVTKESNFFFHLIWITS